MEGDCGTPPRVIMVCGFNPRPRMEGDIVALAAVFRVSVSIHALVWRATCACNAYFDEESFQSTPSYGGRLLDCVPLLWLSRVSIHALVWRATAKYSLPFFVIHVSIHALVWRATEGRYAFRRNSDVSIHALVWRATFRVTVAPVPRLVSIHALVWRATFHPCLSPYGRSFQSTPSYGGRRNTLYATTASQAVSIHALVWRATLTRSVYS